MSNTVQPFAEQGHYTEFHNLALDYIMPRVSGSAWKVLSLILRKTKGWGKASDAIAYRQIKAGTGIKSDATVKKALGELLGMGCIRSKNGAAQFDANRYALNRGFSIPTSEIEVPASENEVGEDWSTSIIEVATASENEVAATSKIEDTKATKKQSKYLERKEEGENAREASPYLATSSPRSSSPQDSQGLEARAPEPEDAEPPPEVFPVVEALREVCGKPPLPQLSPKERHDIRAACAFALDQAGNNPHEAARLVRLLYSAPCWDFPNPPHLSQIRAGDWARLSAKAANLEAQRTNAPQRPQSAQERLYANRQAHRARLAPRLEQIYGASRGGNH